MDFQRWHVLLMENSVQCVIFCSSQTRGSKYFYTAAISDDSPTSDRHDGLHIALTSILPWWHFQTGHKLRPTQDSLLSFTNLLHLVIVFLFIPSVIRLQKAFLHIKKESSLLINPFTHAFILSIKTFCLCTYGFDQNLYLFVMILETSKDFVHWHLHLKSRALITFSFFMDFLRSLL